MSKENKVIVVSYDQNLNRLGVIDVFRSLIWTRKYYECGTFELHAPLNTRNLQLLAENNNNYIYRECFSNDVCRNQSVCNGT